MAHNVLMLAALLVFAFSLLPTLDCSRNVTITLLESALSKGAVCLDGSAPGYAYLQGYGDGENKWIVFMRGGAWCFSRADCHDRSFGSLGSSAGLNGFLSLYHNHLQFGGIFDDNATLNPAFYNWNKVQIMYCDGSSFLSYRKEVDMFRNKALYYRGGRIFDAMIEELMVNKGMAGATHAILAGTSAGGLAAILHCDKFGALFNNNATNVKCLSDSGFFIHGMDLIGADVREAQWFNIIQTHGLNDLLPSSCTMKFSPTLCLFPENLVPDIKTPLFLIESAFDAYQIGNNVFQPIPGHWKNCTNDLKLCNWTDIHIMKEFGSNFIKTLKNNIEPSSSFGYFVHSCFRHGHIYVNNGWALSYLEGAILLANKMIEEAFSDWYFNDATFQEIDMKNDLPRNCTRVAPH